MLCLEEGHITEILNISRVMIILMCPLLEELNFVKASCCLCTCTVLTEAHTNLIEFVQGSLNETTRHSLALP